MEKEYLATEQFKSLRDLPPWMEIHQRIGEQIKLLRQALGMTQDQLAKRAGMAQSAVAQIESGVRKDLCASTIRKIGEALNCETMIRLTPKKDILEFLDEKSTAAAKKIMKGSTANTAIELQLPEEKTMNRQLSKIKSEILEKHRSFLWQ